MRHDKGTLETPPGRPHGLGRIGPAIVMAPADWSSDRTGKYLALAFVAVVSSFFLSTFVVFRSSGAAVGLAEEIIENTTPSITHLARVRKDVLEAELALFHTIEDPVARPATPRALETALADADKSVRAYLALDPTPGEHRLMLDVQDRWREFSSAIAATRKLALANDVANASTAFVEQVEPARARILDAVTVVMEHNATIAGHRAIEIRRLRARSVRLANALNVVCALLAATVAWLIHRTAQNRKALAMAHLRGVEDRAAELEQFAGRVAHDIRGPLAAARLSAQLVDRRSTEDATRKVADKLIKSLDRAEEITSALLEFARAGARPDPGARTEVPSVLEGVIGELTPEAERAQIELRVAPPPEVSVAGSTGVYLSLAGNLIRNAIKYMGSVSTRRIEVRVIEEDHKVRTEVIDTGPGIAEDKVPTLFEPYFQGQRGAEGLGLGLATVKKLAERHGGAVGVRSRVGEGSTFWFELPRA